MAVSFEGPTATSEEQATSSLDPVKASEDLPDTAEFSLSLVSVDSAGWPPSIFSLELLEKDRCDHLEPAGHKPRLTSPHPELPCRTGAAKCTDLWCWTEHRPITEL